MRLLRRRQTNKPKGRMAGFLHVLFTAVLPFTLFALVNLDFVPIAFLVVLLSKWRMLAVKLRHWPANIRANAVDIFVGLSVIIFMNNSGSQMLQLAWVFFYIAWLLFIKPQSSTLWIGIQALLSQTVTLVAVFLVWNDASETALTFGVWGITYLCARHFLAAFDEAMARSTAYVWAFFCASLTWLSAHWLLYYNVISQPALIITVIGYGMGAMYFLSHTERLRPAVRRQFVSLIIAVVLFILIFSDWSGDII